MSAISISYVIRIFLSFLAEKVLLSCSGKFAGTFHRATWKIEMKKTSILLPPKKEKRKEEKNGSWRIWYENLRSGLFVPTVTSPQPLPPLFPTNNVQFKQEQPFLKKTSDLRSQNWMIFFLLFSVNSAFFCKPWVIVSFLSDHSWSHLVTPDIV